MLKYQNNEDKADKRKKHLIGVANVQAIQQYFGQHQAQFTKSMKNISNAIIKHPDILKNNLLVNFSKTLDLGEASVMRFCKHLGFRGFTEFKKYFIEQFFELPDENTKAHIYDIDLKEEVTPSDVLTKLSNMVARTTLETKQMLAQKNTDLLESVHKLYNAGKVFIFGPPSAKAIIEETASRLTSIGLVVLTGTEIHEMASKACRFQKGDVAISISSSGYHLEVVNVAQQLQKSRVYHIALTNNPRSELAITADVVFTTYGPHDKDFHLMPDSTYTRISQMIIFDVLITLTANQDVNRAKEQRINTINTIEKLIVQNTEEPTDKPLY